MRTCVLLGFYSYILFGILISEMKFKSSFDFGIEISFYFRKVARENVNETVDDFEN